VDVIWDQLVQDYGAVTYEAFINLLVRQSICCGEQGAQLYNTQVDITEDQTTPDQLRDAFRGIASDKVGT
jgi:hypothetical protein